MTRIDASSKADRQAPGAEAAGGAPPDPERRVAEMRETLERTSRKLVEAREAARRASELAEVRGRELARVRARLERAERAAARVDQLEEEARERHARLMNAEVRLQRLHDSLPFRALGAVRSVPPVSWIVARRTRRFHTELERAYRGR